HATPKRRTRATQEPPLLPPFVSAPPVPPLPIFAPSRLRGKQFHEGCIAASARAESHRMPRPRLPKLTEHKLLPPGIHRLALPQIQRLFGEFQSSDRRPRLFQRLADFVTEVRKTGWQVQILID